MKKNTPFFLSIVLLVSVCLPAGAYVLQGQHLLELMTQNFKNARRLFVSQKLILFDNNGKKSEVELNETLQYDFPARFRSDILSENVQRIHVLSDDVALTIIDGKAVMEPENRYERYKDIILFNSRELLEKRLLVHGVDVTVSSLGRYQGKPAWVLGAQYPDESVPQIWLDKDTFRPFRWIITGKAANDPETLMEVRYLQWQKVHKTWYPMQIEFYKNDTLLRKINVDNIEAVPSFTEDIFNIEHLKSIYSANAPRGRGQSNEKELDEVQRTIEKFKKIYE